MVPERKPAPLYLIGLIAAAGGMLVLPVVYISLIALTGWGVYYFATHAFLQIWQWPIGRSFYGMVLRIVCSVTPLLAGAMAVIFMIKPLFARKAKRIQAIALNPSIDGRIFELVHSICQTLGAPRPVRIELDCAVNAAAAFEKGLGGVLNNRLVLTLGLPLCAGLTQRELAGVIAHEFGHFRQGVGMRLSYFIRQVNHWFVRVVYERDSCDEALEEADGSSDGWIRFMISCARIAVWFSRRILWLLMMAGHIISSFLLRQMEYDADRAEIELAGSRAFESTTMKLAALGAIFSDLHLDMKRSWRNQFKLPDNLPLLTGHLLSKMPAERRTNIENKVGLGRTGLLDSHPSAADRVRNARRLGSPGYEISDEPASDLFENFAAISKIVTLAYYEDDLNIPTGEDFLIPVNVTISDGEATVQEPVS